MKCTICKRRLGKKKYTWLTSFIGLKDICNICEECNLSVTNQIIEIMDMEMAREQERNKMKEDILKLIDEHMNYNGELDIDTRYLVEKIKELK